MAIESNHICAHPICHRLLIVGVVLAWLFVVIPGTMTITYALTGSGAGAWLMSGFALAFLFLVRDLARWRCQMSRWRCERHPLYHATVAAWIMRQGDG